MLKISKHDFLTKETWVNITQRIVVTADLTWGNSVGDVHHGFNMKKLSEDQFTEALSSRFKDPGDYILENFPAEGTFLKDRLEHLSIDEAHYIFNEMMRKGDEVKSFTYEDHDFNYEVSLYRGYGYSRNETLAFEANTAEEALVCASIADCAANAVDADSPEVEEIKNDQSWVYLDRSPYGYSNVYLNIDLARVDEIR